MGKTGHQTVGVALAAISAAYLHLLHFGWMPIGASCVAAFYGSTAPDWLEISHADKMSDGSFKRVSVIPHRTITHWAIAWVAFLVWALFSLPNPSPDRTLWLIATFHTAALGFAIGGIGHLLCDIPNPTGVPILMPTSRYRLSLRLWRSGSGIEWLEVTAFWMIGVASWMVH